MDSRYLESFVMVAENGSFAETARRLHLTPWAVAQRIRALEVEVGTRLMSRSGRSVRPTAAGTAILPRARNFLGDVRDLKSIAAAGRPVGELRLGAPATAISGLLPDILVSLTKKYPEIDVFIQNGISVELYHQVLGGTLDAAIVVQPPFAIPKGYDWRLLREDPLVVLTQASARERDPHVVLASEPFIRPRPTSWIGQLVDGYLRQAGIRPNNRFDIDILEAVAVLVDRGLGVGLVPDWAPPWPEGLSIRKLPLPPNRFGRRMGLVWSKASVRAQLVHAFLDVAAESLPVDGAQSPKSKGRARHR
jgi:DNA-binding transcriptional LysR family regulator